MLRANSQSIISQDSQSKGQFGGSIQKIDLEIEMIEHHIPNLRTILDLPGQQL